MVVTENILEKTINFLTVTVYCIFLSLFFSMLNSLIWSFKFYFSSYLQTDSSAYKPEWLTPPPLPLN